jgi:hypothetical protein
VREKKTTLRVRKDTECGFWTYERLAAGSGSTAAVIIAAAIVVAATPTIVSAAAPNDDQQNDDPAAITAAPTIVTHTGTSYENVDRPKRSQSIVCGGGREVMDYLFSDAGHHGLGRGRL